MPQYGIILVIMRQLHKSRDVYYYPVEAYMDIIFIRSMQSLFVFKSGEGYN
jgi:hypothetical protein